VESFEPARLFQLDAREAVIALDRRPATDPAGQA
jgi:hypothetical protein